MSSVRVSSALALLLLILFLAGCSEQSPEATLPPAGGSVDGAAVVGPADTVQPTVRPRDFAQLARGSQLYQQYCASCHGDRAQGDPGWRQRGTDGRLPPPPLNGSAHAWHHPMAQLKQVIREGGPAGQSNMPAWGGTLSEQQIEDIIVWFQSLWSDEIYQTWAEMDTNARDRG